MHYVLIQTKPRDLYCAICGEEIRKGAVFVMKHGTINGHETWLPVHLWCNAAQRGAQMERVNSLAPLPREGVMT